MKVRWIFGLIVLTMLVACKKQTIDIQELPETNDPVFRITGTVDNEVISIQAGVDGAKVENSTEFRNNVLFTFGQMLTSNDKYRIGIFDGNTDVDPLSAVLTDGDTLFLADRFKTPLAVLSKATLSNADKISSIKWYIDGEFVGMDEYQIMEPGKYEVCGEYTFYNNQVRKICNTIVVGFQNNMKVQTHHFMTGTNMAQMWISGEDSLNVASVKWYHGDTLLGEGLTCTAHVWYYSTIRVEITSNKNKVHEREFLVDGLNLGCYTEDFQAFVTPIAKTWDYAVAVEIERNGQSYSTLNSENFKSKLLVKKFEVYEVRANGDVVYKLEGTIDAKLSNANQSSFFFIHLDYVYPFILKN